MHIIDYIQRAAPFFLIHSLQIPEMAYRYPCGRYFFHTNALGTPGYSKWRFLWISSGDIENLTRHRFDCQNLECENRQKKVHELIVIWNWAFAARWIVDFQGYRKNSLIGWDHWHILTADKTSSEGFWSSWIMISVGSPLNRLGKLDCEFTHLLSKKKKKRMCYALRIYLGHKRLETH